MSRNSWKPDSLRVLFTIGIVLLVFCFWFFLYPYAVVGQECLFIWDYEFWEERTLGQYFKDFLAQFFCHPFIGAVLLAFVFWAFQQIGRLFLRLIVRNRPNVVFATSFVLAFLVTFLLFRLFTVNAEELEYDWLLRQSKWNEIVRKGIHTSPQSLACQNAFRLAQFQMGQIGEKELFAGLTLTNEALSGRTAAYIMSNVYLQTGMVNMSQRASFEAMESIEDFGKSGRALQRLVETALITGQHEIARKYIGLLERTLFYSSWARRVYPLAEHPELIGTHPVYGKLQRMYLATNDVLFN